jgi:hypothetical protein
VKGGQCVRTQNDFPLSSLPYNAGVTRGYTIRAEIGEGVKRVAPLGEGFVHYRADAKQLCIECATEYATKHLMDAMYVAEVHGELPPGMLEEWHASFDC